MNAETERLAQMLDAWLDGDPVAAPPGDLSELLAAAEQVRLLTEVPAPPAGLNRGRAAFVAAGVQQAEETNRAGFLTGLFAAFGRYRLAPMTLMVAVLLMSGVVTTARAQSSLPGDLLYPVKRLAETVQVAIARGDGREAMRAELQQRRRDETQLLLERHRAAPVAFEGLAELGADGVWRVGGVVVQFGRTLPEGLTTGAVVSVTGVTDPDGVVRVSALEVMTPALIAATPAVASLPVDLASPEPVTAIVADEPTPTSRPPSPTPLPVIATQVAVPTLPPTQLPTGVPTSPAPKDPVREKQYTEWSGHLQRSNGEWWIVDGTEFYRPNGLVRGDALTCSFVHVRALLKKDGKLYLEELIVKAPPAKPSREEVKGTISELGDDFIVIDHVRIVRPRNVVLEGDLVVGRFAHLVLRVECGRRIAEKIVVDGPKELKFSGIVEYRDADILVVDGRTLQLNSATVIIGAVVEGAKVEVVAVESDDGVLVAVKVEVVRAAPPTATPTLPPTATATNELPSPTPSDTPAAAATAGPTVAPSEP